MAYRTRSRRLARPSLQKRTAGSSLRYRLARPSRSDWLVALSLSAVVVISYIPAMRAGFVWDDSILVQGSDLHKRSGLRDIWLSLNIEDEAHYWPVTYTTLWAEHQLWGLKPFGYHLTNIGLHLVNSLLVWRLMTRMHIAGAAVIGAVFAVHPLHVESVAWIIERKDVLSGLLYLIAVLSWMRFTESPRFWRYVVTLALYTAGMLAKSVVVTLPAALLIWHWYQHGRITRGDLARLAPLFATGMAIALADLTFYSSREPLDLGYSLAERVMIAARALWFYAGKLLWPTDLIVIYPHWGTSPSDPVNLAFVVATVATVATLWLARHRIGRGPLAGAAFFAVTLAPTLGFIDYGYMQFSFVADRFQYLAGIGVMAVIVGAIAQKMRRHADAVAQRMRRHADTAKQDTARKHIRYTNMTAQGITAVVVILLGVLSWRHASLYRDQVTLFSHIVEHNPQARMAHANLGAGYMEAGRYEDGIDASEIALALTPDEAGLYANIALAHMHLGHFDLAEENMHLALEIEPNSAESMFKLGNVLRGAKKHEEAVEQYRAALAIDETIPEAHAGMGVSLYELDRHEEALKAFRQALALHPNIAQAWEIHRFSGLATRALGDWETAVHHHEKAFESNPSHDDIAIELSAMLTALERHEEADMYLRHTRALHPDADAMHFFALGEQLRSQGLHEKAIEAYRSVLEHSPDHARAHAGLGESLHKEGLHEKAIKIMERALELHVESHTERALHYLIADAALQSDSVNKAAEHLEAALETDPGFTEALDSLARLRFSQEDYTEALRHFETLAEIQPDDAGAITNVGVVLFHLGRSEEALKRLDEALALDPTYETAIANRSEVIRSIQDARNTP